MASNKWAAMLTGIMGGMQQAQQNQILKDRLDLEKEKSKRESIEFEQKTRAGEIALREAERAEVERKEKEERDSQIKNIKTFPEYINQPQEVQKLWFDHLKNSGYVDKNGEGTIKNLRTAMSEMYNSSELWGSLMKPAVDWQADAVVEAETQLKEMKLTGEKPEKIQKQESIVGEMRRRYDVALNSYRSREALLNKQQTTKANEGELMNIGGKGFNITDGVAEPILGAEGPIEKPGTPQKESRKSPIVTKSGKMGSYNPDEGTYKYDDGTPIAPGDLAFRMTGEKKKESGNKGAGKKTTFDKQEERAVASLEEQGIFNPTVKQIADERRKLYGKVEEESGLDKIAPKGTAEKKQEPQKKTPKPTWEQFKKAMGGKGFTDVQLKSYYDKEYGSK